MTIFFFALGAKDRASSRLRVWDHLDWFRERGESVIADSLTPLASEASRLRIGLRVVRRLPKWISAFFRSDAVMIQEALLLWPLLYVKNLGKRRRVVFDFSDPVDRHGTGLKARLRRSAFDRMVRLSDVTIVENKSYLDALRGKAPRLDHFYGPVNASRYAAERAKLGAASCSRERLRIGWTGSPSTYRFIKPLLPVIDRIAAEHPLEVLLIGISSIDYIFEHASALLVPWDEEAEFSTVPTFQLGLFRLEATPDALWRGAGKLFIYMAAGVPFVATDAGIAHGVMAEFDVGYPVDEDNRWEDVLRVAIAEGSGRIDMAERSVDCASEYLSYENYRERLCAQFQG